MDGGGWGRTGRREGQRTPAPACPESRTAGSKGRWRVKHPDTHLKAASGLDPKRNPSLFPPGLVYLSRIKSSGLT